MNAWQMAQQIKHVLQQVRWPIGSQGLVFGTRGSVAVFAGSPTEEQIPPGFPWALVGIDSADVDEDDPGLITQRFALIVAAEVAGDRLGEHAIIGGPARNLGRSAGRGVGEVMERVRFAVEDLNGADGAKIQLSSSSMGAPTAIGNGRHMVLAELGLTAVCTSAADYSAPQQLLWDLGRWTWLGDHCSLRYDFKQFRLVRKTGEEPSRDADDGDLLYTGTDPFWEGQQSAGSTYTVFADYCSRANADIEGSSGPEVGSYRVIA